MTVSHSQSDAPADLPADPPAGRVPSAAVYGCAGTVLTDAERIFFKAQNPLGLILFQRNCTSPDQIQALVEDFRSLIGDPAAPVLIDQEGGRVQRLKPPAWRDFPAAARFAELDRRDRSRAEEALRLNARMIAADLADLGITVDCWPVLDLPQADADPIIGDRAAGQTVEQAARLGRVTVEALWHGGVIPVIKHLPGHGRATVDSHLALPRVAAPLDELELHDFAPFAALSDQPCWGMTAHVVYEAIDPERPATLSGDVVGGVIRERIGFDGFLVSDDLSMKALDGDFASRAMGALDAGCDAVLHCNGDMAEMQAVASGVRPMDEAALRRWRASEERRVSTLAAPLPADVWKQLQALLSQPTPPQPTP